jgi:hypothetical protein
MGENTPIVVAMTNTPGRTIADLSAPILVVVYRRDLVDLRELRNDEISGRIRLDVRETPCR